MADETWESLAWVAGVAAVVLFIVATYIAGSPPGPHDSVVKVFNYVHNNGTAIKWGGYLVAFGIFLLIFWVAALANAARRALNGPNGLVTVIVVGATVALGLELVATAVANVEVLRIGELGAGGVHFFFALNYVLGAVGLFGTAALVLGVSLVVLQTGFLPRWLGPAGLVLTVALLVAGAGVATLGNTVGVISLVSFLAWAVWVVAISVLMLVRSTAAEPLPSTAGSVAPTPPPPPS